MSDTAPEDGESLNEPDDERPSRHFRLPLLGPHERYPNDLVRTG